MASKFCTEELIGQLERRGRELRRLEGRVASGQASPLDQMMLEATRRTRATPAQGLHARRFVSLGRPLHVHMVERRPCVSHAEIAVMPAVRPQRRVFGA